MNVRSTTKQLKNGAIYLLPIVFSSLLPLVTLPIFTRFLTPGDYGVWGLAQIYASFAIGISNLGLTIGFERNFFENKEEKFRTSLLYSILLFVIVTFIALGAFTFLFKAKLSEWIIGSPDHSNLLFWSYCTAGIMSLKSYYLIYFKNSENAKSLTKYTIGDSILMTIFSLFLVTYLRIGIIGLVLGQLLAGIVSFSLLSFIFIKSKPVTFNLVGFKNSLKISLPLTPRIFFGVIGNQFDKYLIGLLNTVGGVGIFSLGQKIANITFTFMTAIQNVFSPVVYSRMFEMGEEGKKSIGKYLTPFLYVSLFIGILVSLFSEEIIILLTPISYHGAIDIAIILSMLYGTYFFGSFRGRAGKTF